MNRLVPPLFKKRWGCPRNKQGGFVAVLGRSNLLTLPVEIVLEIAENLSPVDAACLALCARGLLATVEGRKYYPSLMTGESQNENELRRFLTTLSRDLPGHFFCRNCVRLHPTSLVGPPGFAFQPSKKLRCLYKEKIADFCWYLSPFPHRRDYNLLFTNVHLALKRHWYGPEHGISTESLVYTGVFLQHWRMEGGKPRTNLESVEARISPSPTPTLCLRTQTWAVLNTADRLKIFRCAEDMYLCRHLLSSLLEFFTEPEAGTQYPRIQGYQGVPVVFNCGSCSVETQLEVKALPGEGIAVVVTKWMDLGAGITPPEVKMIFEFTALNATQLLISSNAPDARTRFENQPGRCLDCLSHRNAELLIGKAYKKEMDLFWGLGPTWILQGERRLPILSNVSG